MEKVLHLHSIEINPDAPVVASCNTLIQAGIDEVWELLSDINRWPMWMSSVSDAWLDGDLEPGTPFTWRKDRMKIKSVIQSLKPGKNLTWSGSMLGIRAVHTWNLEQKGTDQTFVTTAESMEGVLARWLLSSQKLEEILTGWLSELKTASET
jgi:hypothetical protein